MTQSNSNRYTFHLEPTHREYKARNVLTLEDRVAVIRDYEKNPVYQRLAEKYNCSSKQIKNIIANREAVLLYFDNRKADGSTSEERRQRQQKIAFLGKVIYEFIQRAVYHGLQISVSSVRRKALEVKESIAIMNFFPNNAWLHNFKAQYQVPEFDLMTLRQSMFLSEAKEMSIKAVDLIQFVSRREKENDDISKRADRRDNRKSVQTLMENDEHTAVNNWDFGEPTVTYENDDFDYMEDSNDENRCDLTAVVSLDDSDNNDMSDDFVEQRRRRAKRSSINEYGKVMGAQTSLPDINCYADAQRYLKALEDYALLGDNFRAIGLIEQLQQVLKAPPRIDDFQA